MSSTPSIPQALLKRAAAAILERIARDAEKVESRPVCAMLEYIREHLFSRDLTVKMMKRSLSIRDNSAALHFHAETGMPPHQYISAARLDVAARLLQDTDLPAWRIAESVGYSSIQVFSRAFVRERGTRPMAFRKAARTGNASQGAPPTQAVSLYRRAARGDLSLAEAGTLISHIASMYFETPEPS